MFEIRPFERRSNEIYDPFREFDELERAFFGDNFFPMMAMPMHRPYHKGRPHPNFRTDIRDNGDSYLLEADLPGFNKEDINIEFDDDVMTIKADRHEEVDEKDEQGNYIRRERRYGCYQRSFDLTGIDTEGMKASYDNGVLKLTMPKKAEPEVNSRRLQIE